MRRLRDFYSIFPGDNVSQGCIRIDSARVLFVDGFDLRTYQMVLPQLERKDLQDLELSLAQTLTPPNGVFVDIGANVGVLSLFALSDSVAAVHSFEPNPAMMSLLRKTRAANPLAARWHLHESAIGAALDRLRLSVDSDFSGTASLIETWQGSDKRHMVEVPVITLDHWRHMERVGSVDVVKIDVEGWEFAVLEGARDTLRAFKPFVWFEHNLPALHRSGRNPGRVLDILQELGYEVFYDIGTLPDDRPLSRREIDNIDDRRINFLAVSHERIMDLNTRVLPAMRTLS